jgi:hypothetical protein
MQHALCLHDSDMDYLALLGAQADRKHLLCHLLLPQPQGFLRGSEGSYYILLELVQGWLHL